MNKRTVPSTIVLVVAAVVLGLVGGAVGTATAGPAVAKITKSKVKKIAKMEIAKAAASLSVANATNAGKVDGLDANQLVRATTVSATTVIDGFSSVTFTDVLSRSVTAPTAGIFIISGHLNTARDVDGGASCLINVRASVDGTAATIVTSLRDTTTHNSIYGTPAAVGGAFPVSAGAHTVALQASMMHGQAFLTSRSLTVTFVPFGDAGVQPPETRPGSLQQ